MLNRPLKNMIGELDIRCKHHSAAGDKPKPKRSKRVASSSASDEPKGCPWQGKLNDLDAHLRSCPFEAVECPLGCGKRATRDELDAHQQVCPRRMVLCDQGCGTECRADLLDQHKADTCTATVVKCACCDEKMRRGDLGGATYKGTGMTRAVGRHSSINETTVTLCGHYAVCPKLKLSCPHSGCFESFKREDAAAHHTAFAQKHAHLVQRWMTSLQEEMGWEKMDMTWKVPVSRLAGSRQITLKSECCEAAGFEIFMKLTAEAQTAPISVFLCAEEPNWTPVKVKNITISVRLKEGQFDDDENGGLLSMGFFDDSGRRGQGTNLEGSPDPQLGGTLTCSRKGARIGDSDEDDMSLYEWEEDTVTRQDLIDAAQEENVQFRASVWLQKVQSVNLGCR